jgi:hypothetical protein
LVTASGNGPTLIAARSITRVSSIPSSVTRAQSIAPLTTRTNGGGGGGTTGNNSNNSNGVAGANNSGLLTTQTPRLPTSHAGNNTVTGNNGMRPPSTAHASHAADVSRARTADRNPLAASHDFMAEYKRMETELVARNKEVVSLKQV